MSSEDSQHLALAVGEVNDVFALAQFAALEVIDVRAKRDLLHRSGLWRRRGALEDVVDAQRKLARLERLCDVIVGADLQALDAASASCRAVSITIGTEDEVRMKRARSKPVSPGIMTSRIKRSKCRPKSLERASLALAAVETR